MSKIILLVISLLVQSQVFVVHAQSEPAVEEENNAQYERFCENKNANVQKAYEEVGAPCCSGYVPYKSSIQNKSYCVKQVDFPWREDCIRRGVDMDLITGECQERATGSSSKNGDTTHSGADFWKRCQTSYETAAGACDLDENQKSAMAFVKQGADEASASFQRSCTVWGEASQAMNAGLAAFKGYCSTGYSSCSTTCEDELKEVRGLRDISKATDAQVSHVSSFKNKCEGLSSNLAEAGSLVQQFMAKDAQMKNCHLLTGKTIQEQCAANPSSSPMCSAFVNGADCSNPQTAATNPVCLCRTPGAQAAAGCQRFLEKAALPGSGLGNSSTTGAVDGTGNGALGNFGGLGGGFGGGGVGIGSDGKPNPENGGSLVRPGGGKANVGENGGGSNKQPGNNAGAGGGGGSGYNAKIIGGYGFGGNGPTGSNGSSGSNSQPYGQNSGGYGQNGTGQKVDLRQFLPGGKRDPSRGLAGISGPDGITGPNSSIWKKINARYYAVSPTLLP